MKGEPAERRERLARATAARGGWDPDAGLLMVALGVAIILVPIVVVVVLWYANVFRWDGTGSVMLLFLAVALVAIKQGRQMRVSTGTRALAEDPRPPVVYLRPFDADGVQIAKAWSSRVRMSFWDQYGLTYEERLARILRRIGPFVAVGDPTEDIPLLGAARVYAADEDWQMTVGELIDRAGVVLLQVGASEGLAWEVGHVVALGAPERVILSLPLTEKRKTGSRRERYDAFRRRFGDVFPRPLPDSVGHCQFAYFDADWTPRLLGERGAPLPAGDDARTLALRRLAREFKITWGPRWMRMTAYVGAGLAVLYGIESLPL